MLAYPLARMRFRGAAMLAVTVTMIYLVPQTLLLFLSRSSVRAVPIGVVGELIRGDALLYWGQLMTGRCGAPCPSSGPSRARGSPLLPQVPSFEQHLCRT